MVYGLGVVLHNFNPSTSETEPGMVYIVNSKTAKDTL